MRAPGRLWIGPGLWLEMVVEVQVFRFTIYESAKVAYEGQTKDAAMADEIETEAYAALHARRPFDRWCAVCRNLRGVDCECPVVVSDCAAVLAKSDD